MTTSKADCGKGPTNHFFASKQTGNALRDMWTSCFAGGLVVQLLRRRNRIFLNIFPVSRETLFQLNHFTSVPERAKAAGFKRLVYHGQPVHRCASAPCGRTCLCAPKNHYHRFKLIGCIPGTHQSSDVQPYHGLVFDEGTEGALGTSSFGCGSIGQGRRKSGPNALCPVAEETYHI